MKLFFRSLFIACIIYGCDTGESLVSEIENKTSIDIKIYFVSKFIYPNLVGNAKVVRITSMNSFIDNSRTTPHLGQAILSFVEHDSIYITDSSNKLLKVYREDTPGKNIYDVDKYWSAKGSSRNVLKYTYTINDADIR